MSNKEQCILKQNGIKIKFNNIKMMIKYNNHYLKLDN